MSRGGKNGDALLLNGDGNMCCLGFLGKTCGYKRDQLDGNGTPSDVVGNSKSKWPKSLVDNYNNTELCNKLMKANDRKKQSDSKKEERIKKLGKEAGINFTFIY